MRVVVNCNYCCRRGWLWQQSTWCSFPVESILLLGLFTFILGKEFWYSICTCLLVLKCQLFPSGVDLECSRLLIMLYIEPDRGVHSLPVGRQTGWCQWIFFFLKFFVGHKSFLWGHWYPCFGRLVMSALGSKDRVDSLACMLPCLHTMGSSDSPLVWHLPFPPIVVYTV